MEPKRNGKLTPLETLIMGCVWRQSPATVRQVREQLKGVKPMAYNTVLTVMRILRDKGFLQSKRQERVDLYTPRVSRKQVAARSLRELVNVFFAGSAGALVSHLFESHRLTPDEVRQIRREIDLCLSQAGNRGNKHGSGD